MQCGQSALTGSKGKVYFTKLCISISWVLVGAYSYANISNILEGLLNACDDRQLNIGEFIVYG